MKHPCFEDTLGHGQRGKSALKSKGKISWGLLQIDPPPEVRIWPPKAGTPWVCTIRLNEWALMAVGQYFSCLIYFMLLGCKCSTAGPVLSCVHVQRRALQGTAMISTFGLYWNTNDK